MIKYKLYIVTYKNISSINSCIKSIINTNLYQSGELAIYIINNSPSYNLDHLSNNNIYILNNVLRPEFSTGHLSRNWNQAIINGFQNINNPNCEILMHCQDDTIFEVEGLDKIIDYHKNFNFISLGVGDAFCSYTIECIQKIGLWDERFCGIGSQEADYFTRNLIFNKNKCSINDLAHGRIHNPLPNNFVNSPCSDKRGGCVNVLYVSKRDADRLREHCRTGDLSHPLNEKVFQEKYSTNVKSRDWDSLYLQEQVKIISPQPILYPYFENENLYK